MVSPPSPDIWHLGENELDLTFRSCSSTLLPPTTDLPPATAQRTDPQDPCADTVHSGHLQGSSLTRRTKTLPSKPICNRISSRLFPFSPILHSLLLRGSLPYVTSDLQTSQGNFSFSVWPIPISLLVLVHLPLIPKYCMVITSG